jgi:hypothetical protein
MARSGERMFALGCLLEEGLTYPWFQVSDLDDEAVTATITVVDPDNDNEVISTHEVGPDDVARGLKLLESDLRARSIIKSDYRWQTVRFGHTNGDKGDYDADTADLVLQFATLGKVVFG